MHRELGELVGWSMSWWGSQRGPHKVSPIREDACVMFLTMGLGDKLRQRMAVVGGRERGCQRTLGDGDGTQASGKGRDRRCGRSPTGVVLTVALGRLFLPQPLHHHPRRLLERLHRVVGLHHGEEDLVLHHDAPRALRRGHGAVRGAKRGDPHPKTHIRTPLPEADDLHALVAGDGPVDLPDLQSQRAP